MEKKPFIPKEGKGRLFQNTRREGRQPNWRGDAMVNGVHVQISGWDNDDGSISLAIERKGERANQPASTQTRRPNPDDQEPPF